MKPKSTKKIIFSYLILAILAVFIFFVIKIFPEAALNTFFFTFFVAYLILLPGWLLIRLARINFSEYLLTFHVSLVLSLGFYFIINFIAIFFGLTINQLLTVYYIIVPLLFIVSFISEFLKDSSQEKSFYWRQFLIKKNLIFILPIIFGLLIFLAVSFRGADFNGDPYYHLAMARKAIGTEPLTIKNLAYVKNATTSPAYTFPVWSILIGLFSKVAKLDLVSTWGKLPAVLAIFVLSSWYFLAKTIFRKTNLTIIAAIVTYFFLYYPGGYIFQRLPVPDSFSQFIFTPIILGLAIKYIFDSVSRKIFWVFSVSLMCLLFLHGLHFIYILLILTFLALFLTTTAFKDQNYKKLIVKSWTLVGITLVLPVILLIIFELKSGSISKALSWSLANDNLKIVYEHFTNLPPIYQLAVILTPLSLVFLKRRSLSILPTSLILVSLTYFTPLGNIFSKLFSTIFTKRLLGNVFLYFFIIALILGAILILIEIILSRFKSMIRNVIFLILLGFLGWLTYLEVKFQKMYWFFDNNFFDKIKANYIISWFWPFLSIVIVLTIVLILWDNYVKKLELEEFKNHFSGFVLVFFLTGLLFLGVEPNLTAPFKSDQLFGEINYQAKIYYPDQGSFDQGSLNFLAKIPPKSTILADPGTSKTLAMLLDDYMAYNLGSAWEKPVTDLFSLTKSSAQKDEILFGENKLLFDLVFIRDPSQQDENYFAQKSNVFQKVYDGQVKIYKIQK